MPSSAKGKKYGRELVRAVPEPLDGKVITGRVTAANDNFDGNLAGAGALPVRAPEPMIEGVTVKAVVAAAGGTVYIVEQGGNPAYGFPLANGESVDIQTDRLSKVSVRIPAAGDSVVYLAIAAAES